MPDEFKAQPPASFDPILLATPEPPLIVGGQAVNLWASLFSSIIPEIQKFQPFTSRDCDLVADAEYLFKIANRTRWKMTLSKPGSASPVIGYLEAKHSDGAPLLIEVLHSVKGLTSEELQN